MATPSELYAPAEQRPHGLRNTLTTLRLRTLLPQRLDWQQGGDDWQRQADGLAAIDADLSRLLRQSEHHDGPDRRSGGSSAGPTNSSNAVRGTT